MHAAAGQMRPAVAFLASRAVASGGIPPRVAGVMRAVCCNALVGGVCRVDAEGMRRWMPAGSLVGHPAEVGAGWATRARVFLERDWNAPVRADHN